MPSPIKSADPLTQPPNQTWAIYTPVALKEAITRDAEIDGYRSASAYVVDLLAWAINARRQERQAARKK